MRIEIVKCDLGVTQSETKINLGHRGETGRTLIKFDLSDFVNEYGAVNTAMLWIRKPNESEATPNELPINAGVVEWYVSAADTENSGGGECQIEYRNGTVTAKSAIYLTRIEPAL